MAPRRSAEIEALSRELGRPLAEGWAMPMAPFDRAFADYMEYQVSFGSGDLSLITLGTDAPYLGAIETHLDAMGVTQAELSQFGRLRRFSGPATWGVKLATGAERRAQVYLKKPLPITEALFWLMQRGYATADSTGHIAAMATILGKDHLHFLGVDFVPDAAPRFEIYFTQYVDSDDAALVGRRVAEALREVGCGQYVDAFLRYHALLAQPQTTLWVSVGVDNQALLPSAKVDYSDVRLAAASLVLEDSADDASAADQVESVRHLLSVEVADHLGIRFLPSHSLTVSAYLTRVG